jgi:hypothetical protein
LVSLESLRVAEIKRENHLTRSSFLCEKLMPLIQKQTLSPSCVTENNWKINSFSSNVFGQRFAEIKHLCSSSQTNTEKLTLPGP